MSTQAITDYLTKQLFIEKNIVTFRALSRHLSIHVNAAKNELATYHHNAPYQSQSCVATFLLSGTPVNNTRHKSTQNSDEDYYMGGTQPTNTRDEEAENDGEEVPQTIVMIVNEKDLEDAKALFDEVHSIHVYSLSPAPLHDASLLCPSTAVVRNTDKSKGPEFAATVGRIVAKGIKVGSSKKKMAPPPAPEAGPSKPKQPETKPEVKQETKEKSGAAAPEKPKGSGKLSNFFGGAAKPKESKEVRKIKQEEPAPEPAKRMFFSKPTAPKAASDAPQKQKTDAPQKVDVLQKADAPQRVPSSKTKTSTSKVPSRAPSVSSTKEEKAPEKETEKSTRGIKRKSSVGLEKRDKSPQRNADVSKAEGSTRVRRKVVLSDDEEEIIPKKSTARKSRGSYRTDSLENSDAEHDVMKLMDMDDDEVEKVSRVPSTNASSNERDDFEDEMDDNESMYLDDEDVRMSDVPSKKAKVVRKRKPKTVIPVGRNGLKKRKVTKTRKTKDGNGYFVKEDYSDWESVASDEAPEEPAPPKAKPKAKPKTVAVKKEEEEVQIKAIPARKEVKEPAPKKAPIKVASAPKPKPAAKTGGKAQQPRLMNFFGPKKTT